MGETTHAKKALNVGDCPCGFEASMRPRRIAAENGILWPSASLTGCRFNEAAAQSTAIVGEFLEIEIALAISILERSVWMACPKFGCLYSALDSVTERV